MECRSLRPLLQYIATNYAIAVKPVELDGFSSIVIYLTANSKYKLEKQQKAKGYRHGNRSIKF